MNASGCGATVREYAHHLAGDAQYADKARRISALTRDLSEFVEDLVPVLGGLVRTRAAAMAVHVPCTLQHGQKLPGQLERVLRALRFDVRIGQEHHRAASRGHLSGGWSRYSPASCARASWATWRACRRASSYRPT